MKQICRQNRNNFFIRLFPFSFFSNLISGNKTDYKAGTDCVNCLSATPSTTASRLYLYVTPVAMIAMIITAIISVFLATPPAFSAFLIFPTTFTVRTVQFAYTLFTSALLTTAPYFFLIACIIRSYHGNSGNWQGKQSD